MDAQIKSNQINAFGHVLVCLQYVSVHLSFLQFVLEVGQMYLPWHRARDMWDCLAANPDACTWDREVSAAP